MAIRKISEVFEEKPRTLSFEFFPPKTDKGRNRLYSTAEALMQLDPDFFSVTYGAGGSTSKSTLEIVQNLQHLHDIPVMHHFTCTKHNRQHIREQIEAMKADNIRNIMALRGDPPADEPDYEPGPDEPRYAFELVQMIREHGDWFSVGVAAFPEGHLETHTLELDSIFTRIKQEMGADFAVTQLFFEVDLYKQFVARLAEAGVTMRVIPGVMLITSWKQVVRFCDTCGATVAPHIREIFEPLADDDEAAYARGIEIVTEQCRDLLDCGAPGLHFYCGNRFQPAATVLDNLGDFR
jgi:methylenetetrahydrofolate reductase (NADPH)